MPKIVPAPPNPPGLNRGGPLAGATTWLCTFTVLVDLPTNMAVPDMEGLIAQAIAANFVSLGLPANVSAQLVATAGNVTVLNPTPGVVVVPTPPNVSPV